MRGIVLIALILISIALGQELYTGEALTRTGSGKLNEDPFRYSLKVIFHLIIWVTLFVLLLLPKRHLDKVNEWLKPLDSKYNDKEK